MEQRDNVRVKDRLQITYRLIDPECKSEDEDAEKYFPPIWNKYPSYLLSEAVNEPSSEAIPHIMELHRKVDILAEILIQENNINNNVEIPVKRNVCISASGIRINIAESSIPRQRIALCIVLPFIPPVNVFIIGGVTRSIMLDQGLTPVKGGEVYETGVKFLHMREDDREKIIKYTFKRQRDILRDKKG